MKMSSYFKWRAQRGFSLVELLVAMVIASVIMAGVVNSFLASKDAYNYNSEMAFIQENARFASNRLSTDIRDSGDFGCATDNPASATTYVTSGFESVLGSAAALAVPGLYNVNGIQGYNTTTTYPSVTIQAAVTAANSSDALLVRRADIEHQMTVSSVVSPTINLTAANAAYNAGTIMVYTDAQCRYQAFFQSRGPAPSAATTTISFSAGGASASLPGNASLMNPTAKSASFQADSKVAPLSSSVYYVAQSQADPSMKSLWVTYLDNSGIPTTQELVVGVDDMRVYYGVDTDGTPDGFANRYVAANTIGAVQDASGGSTLAWNRVASVRVQLLLRSHNKVSTAVSQSLQWDTGAAFVKNDGYLWQIASITVRRRNAFRG